MEKNSDSTVENECLQVENFEKVYLMGFLEAFW